MAVYNHEFITDCRTESFFLQNRALQLLNMMFIYFWVNQTYQFMNILVLETLENIKEL